MDTVYEDRFVIFVRNEDAPTEKFSGEAEHPLISCPTYSDARKIRDALQSSARRGCVIRYVGATGGGD
jgi:hypothetical protein